MTPILKDKAGRVSWKRMIAGKQPGDMIELPLKFRHIAPSQIVRMGYHVKSHATKTSVQITFLDGKRTPDPVIQDNDTPEQKLAALWNQVSVTEGKIVRYQTEALELSTHAARVQAGALVLLYQSQLRTLRAKIAQLQPLSAH